MNNSLFIAWQQLSYQRTKLLAASAGVVVAVMLMLVQLGIRQGAIDNSVSFIQRLTADLVVVSRGTTTIFRAAPFPRRLLYRLPADTSVSAVSEIYIGQAPWKNAREGTEFPINIYGIDPENTMVSLPGYADYQDQLRLMDRFVFDRQSRRNYGPVLQDLADQGAMETELKHRRIRVIGTISVGISITNDGNLYGTPENFLRVFPERTMAAVDLGLVRLNPGADIESAKDRLQQLLGNEAVVMTRPEILQAEEEFLRSKTPIDFIFGLGVMVGFFIGFVVVYQILYTEVTNHLPQLATMKAMGFTDSYLLRLVVWQSLILSTLGYVPGFFMALGVYEIAETQIQMQFGMTTERAVSVWLATIAMCCLSAAIAVRKAWAADPAEVF